MAFCRYCGRKLAEGETCSCRSQASAAASIPFTQRKVSALSLWKEYLSLLKAPASQSVSYVRSGNIVSSLLFFLMHAICSGLFAVLCIGKINSLINLGGSLTESLVLSKASAFFLTLVYSLLLSGILTLLTLAGGKLLRGDLRPQQALCLTSLRSVISIPIALLSCLFFFLNIPAGIILFFFAGLLGGIGFLTIGNDSIAGISRNRKVYLSIIIPILFVLIFLLFSTKALPTYLPSSIRDLFSMQNIIKYISAM